MNNIPDKKLRAIFEKHTIPTAGDPDLTMFDTEAIISDLSTYTTNKQKELIDKLLEALPERTPEYATPSQIQWYDGFTQAILECRKVLEGMI